MHFREVSTILSSNNGMNIYRGCTHGCIYCDSRSDVYGMDHKFEDVEVKSNSLLLLKRALLKRPKSMIGTGSMADPYMPIEKHLEFTLGAIKLIYRYGFGFTCITKSDLILRDVGLLKKINNRAKVVVQMTMTTFDEDLCAKLEPNVCGTARRFEVLKRFQKEEIPTVVWMTPILPFINDNMENIEGILEYCSDAGVYGVIAPEMGVTLRDGNREYFYSKLDSDLKEKYIDTYGDDYSCLSGDASKLQKHFRRLCRGYGIVHESDRIFEYLREFPSEDYQSRLFI